MECKCNLREKLVGDGCEVCNPAKALEYAKATIADLEARLRDIGDYAHEHSTGPAVLIGAPLLTAGLGIETWKKKSRPCGLPYGVMCNCFRCLRARMKAGKEYERMLNAS